jgi:uncharacterized membrane protein (DUF441 family)
MSRETALLVVLLAVGLIAKNRLVSLAAAVALALRLAGARSELTFLEAWGVEIGLVFLTLAVLAPVASGKVAVRDLSRLIVSPVGIAALVGGLTAAWMNARGIEYLEARPTTIVGMVVGSILGTVFLRGIPVGPLAAAGITWILVSLWNLLSR